MLLNNAFKFLKSGFFIKPALLIFLLQLYIHSVFAQNLSKIKILEKRLSEAKSDTSIVNTKTYLAFQYARVDREKANKYLDDAQKLTEQIKYKRGGMLVMGTRAVVLIYEGKYNESTALYQQAIKIAREIHDSEREVSFIINIGHNYTYQNKYPEALKNYIIAEDLAIKINNQRLLAKIYIGKANIQSQSQRYKEAQSSIRKAIQIHKNMRDSALLGEAYSSLGHTFAVEKKHDSALVHLKKSVEIYKKINYLTYIPVAYLDIGYELHAKHEYEEAIGYYLQAEKIFKDSKRDDVQAPLNNYFGNALVELNRFREAETRYKNALAFAKKDGDIEEERDALYGLFLVNKNLNDAKESLRYFERYDTLRNKVFKEEQLARVTEVEVKYETAKKEAAISALNKENNIKSLLLKNNELELNANQNLITRQKQDLTINLLELQNKNQLVKNQQLDAEKKAQNIKTLKKQTQIQNLEIENKKLELKRRNLMIGLILIIFLAMGFVSIAYYNRYRLKQRHLLQAEVFKQQEIATQSLFEGEQKERIRIARDLHDSIGQMLSVVKMNISTMNDLENESSVTYKTARLIDKTIGEVRHISHNLIPEELNFGLFSAIESLCDKINNGKKTLAILQVPDDLSGYRFEKQNELSIYRIIQEVLNNMVKHSEATEIGIDVSKKNNLMVIHIKDNGKGFDTTSIKDSSGIGWKNIAARVSMLNGKLEVTSEILRGTEIEISLPEWKTQNKA